LPFPSNLQISQLQQDLSSLRLQNWLGQVNLSVLSLPRH